MRFVRKGDTVEVLAGNERGKRGKILRVIPAKARVVVQGVNLRWKHLRKSQKMPQGGRIRRESALPIGNVMLVDEASGECTRVGFRGEGRTKVRISRATGREIGAAAPGEKKKGGRKPAAAPEKKE
jgi:large subunit ribosomal protein L24